MISGERWEKIGGRLQEALEEIAADGESTRDEIAALNRTISERDHELAKMRSRIADLEDARAALKIAVEAAREIIAQRGARIAELEAKYSALSKRFDERWEQDRERAEEQGE